MSASSTLKNTLVFLFTLLLLAHFTPANAQLDQVLRLELPIREDKSDDYEVTALGKDGLLLTIQNDQDYKFSQQTWTFIRYDTALNQLWSKDYKINALLQPLKTYHNSRYFYLLLSEVESLDVTIFRLDLESGESEMIEGSVLAYIEVSEFKVLENTAYIAGMVHNRPVVVAFSFFDKRSRVLPGLFGINSEVNDIRIDEQKRTASVIMYSQSKGNCKLSVKTYSYEGKILNDVSIPNEKEKSLVTGKVSVINDRERFLMGNYSVSCSPYSQGMYLTKLEDEKQAYTHYYKFADFKNFFNYMKPRRLEQVKNKIKRLREKGKEMKLRYRLLIHDIIETNDQFILVAEAYYPQYRSSSYSGIYGRTYNDRIFDGYRYTHAVVCGFDKKGNLVWDNSFEILDYVAYELKEVVQISVNRDNVVLAYPQEGAINTKVVKGSTILKDKENHEIKTNFENDKVSESESANVTYWFDQYFVAWGFQDIRNYKDEGVAPNRKVFYLNKIIYLDGNSEESKSQNTK